MTPAQIRKLTRAIETIDPDMNAHQLGILAYLYERFEEGDELIPMAEAQKATGLTKAGISRICAYLSTRRQSGSGGVGLISRTENPIDNRQKDISLTKRGRRLMETLLEI